MAVTREQLLTTSEKVGAVSAELANLAGKIPAAVQGSGAEKIPGVVDSAQNAAKSISAAIEAANQCRQLIRSKVSWMEANGVASLQ